MFKEGTPQERLKNDTPILSDLIILRVGYIVTNGAASPRYKHVIKHARGIISVGCITPCCNATYFLRVHTEDWKTTQPGFGNVTWSGQVSAMIPVPVALKQGGAPGACAVHQERAHVHARPLYSLLGIRSIYLFIYKLSPAP